MSKASSHLTELICRASNLIRQAKYMIALTGAGISTPSGIPDFRSRGSGLWTKYLPMEVASLTTFRTNPELFFYWLHPFASRLLLAVPNAAHHALADMEKAGVLKTIITQNIDALHFRSGSRHVLEVHGTLNTLTCVNCYRQYASEGIIEDYIDNMTIPHCELCNGILKPDVILYEEQLPMRTWLKAEEATRNCDLILVAGTSLEVMPSARLPVDALAHGARLVIVNHTETYVDVRADVILRGDVAQILPRLTEEVLIAG
jgi:NAD-dependent protein deacetylase/lipoamidase